MDKKVNVMIVVGDQVIRVAETPLRAGSVASPFFCTSIKDGFIGDISFMVMQN